MGDRTWVAITVLKESLDQVKEIFSDFYDIEIVEGDYLASLHFDEVNNGHIEEQDDLTEKGIPYNYEWGIGDNYDPGIKYICFTPEGDVIHIEYYDSEVNPPLEKLTELLNEPEELVEFIRKFIEERTPLPWDNQVEYGKIYRARQLILANT